MYRKAIRWVSLLLSLVLLAQLAGGPLGSALGPAPSLAMKPSGGNGTPSHWMGLKSL